MNKLIALAALLAAANAGYVPSAYAPAAYAAPAYASLAAPAVGATSQSTVRSLDGNTVVSQYSKAIDTAFSSVRKYDTRVSNDGVAVVPAYHAPAIVAAPAAYHAPVVAAPVVKTAYAAPAAYRAPVVAAPVLKTAYATPAVAHGGLLGVAYSAAPAVAHITFDGYGIHYGY